MPRLYVHFLPRLAEQSDLAGGTVVVIDVLRASTTIAQALHAGAEAVVPCLEVNEARKVALGAQGGGPPLTSPGPAPTSGYPPGAPRAGKYILGGERGGLRIEGFHLGNSPAEYTPQTVGGRTVVFSTTNGTAAMRAAQNARSVLVSAFVTRKATASELAIASGDIHLLCAGTRNEITGEDVLFAGALLEDLLTLPATTTETLPKELNDSARIALAAWQSFVRSGRDLADYLATETQGGRNLVALGLREDIEFAAQVDLFAFLPRLDVRQWRITK